MVRFTSSCATVAFIAIANSNMSVSDAFSMNLFDRFQRVTKSSVNNILNKFENPEKIMTQAVIDMQVRDCDEQSV
jgi:hypothetical protein